MKKQTPSSSLWGVALVLVLLMPSAVLSEGSGDHVSTVLFPHPYIKGGADALFPCVIFILGGGLCF